MTKASDVKGIFSVHFETHFWGSITTEVKYVSFEKALGKFRSLTTNVAARSGMTTRVFITDGGDQVVAEWAEGKLIYPPKPSFIRIWLMKTEEEK